MLGFSKVNENISRFSAPNIAGNVWNHEELPKWAQLRDFFQVSPFSLLEFPAGDQIRFLLKETNRIENVNFPHCEILSSTKNTCVFRSAKKNPPFFGSAQMFPFFRSWDHKTRRWYFPIKFLLPLFPSPPSSSSSSFQRTKPYDYDNIMIVTSYH